MQKLARPAAVLFDFDGVLVDSEPLHLTAWSLLFAELKIARPLSTHDTAGKSAPAILEEVLDAERPGWSPREFDLADLTKRKIELYISLAKSRLQPMPGALAGLTRLRARGVRTAVVSNAVRTTLLTLLPLLGLSELLDLVVGRDDAAASKPDPAPYTFALRSLHLAPAQCLAVEDSPIGLRSSLAAGIPTAALATTFSAAQLKEQFSEGPGLAPAASFATLAELFAALESA